MSQISCKKKCVSMSVCVCVELGETQDFHQPDIGLNWVRWCDVVRIHVDHRRSVYPVLTSTEVANASGVR